MNLYLKFDAQMVQADKFIDALNRKLASIGNGVDREIIHVGRTERGMMFSYSVRDVEFYQNQGESDFQLRLTRGTKGSIESSYTDDELTEAIDVTVNWLILQEYSSEDHITLAEQLKREAQKYV